MILDIGDNLSVYFNLHPGFEKAATFLQGSSPDRLEPGRHTIDGDQVFANVMEEPGRSRDDAMLEAHRRYIDIQLILAGVDRMGWKPIEGCIEASGEYDSKKDCIFYRDEPDTWFDVLPGQFAIFFPGDAHLPMVSDAPIRKIVFKIALELPAA